MTPREITSFDAVELARITVGCRCGTGVVLTPKSEIPQTCPSCKQQFGPEVAAALNALGGSRADGLPQNTLNPVRTAPTKPVSGVIAQELLPTPAMRT